MQLKQFYCRYVHFIITAMYIKHIINHSKMGYCHFEIVTLRPNIMNIYLFLNIKNIYLGNKSMYHPLWAIF